MEFYRCGVVIIYGEYIGFDLLIRFINVFRRERIESLGILLSFSDFVVSGVKVGGIVFSGMEF